MSECRQARIKVFALSLGEWYMYGNQYILYRVESTALVFGSESTPPRTPDAKGIVVVHGIKIEN